MVNPTPLTLEAMARCIAEGLGDDFDHAHRDKPHWIETRGEGGGRFRDVNEPRQPDYLDAARDILTLIEQSGHKIVPVEATDAEARAYLPCLLEALGDYDEVSVEHAMTRPRYEWIKMLAFRHWRRFISASPTIDEREGE